MILKGRENMKIALIINSSKNNAVSIAKKVADFLKDKGAELLILEPFSEMITSAKVCDDEKLYSLCDVVVAIGGDGTIIHSAKKAALHNKAILGINAGRLGYLAGLEENEISLLDDLLNGNYEIEKRMLLSVELNGKELYCLNDAVISKGTHSRMIDITVSVGNDNVSYRADGLIAATPTGSTAYSLSAGGPIIDPSLESIALTPICPQSLFARPILLHSDALVSITADPPEETGAFLTIDGEESFSLSKNAVVWVKKAENISVSLIKLQDRAFLTALSEKLCLGGI